MKNKIKSFLLLVGFSIILILGLTNLQANSTASQSTQAPKKKCVCRIKTQDTKGSLTSTVNKTTCKPTEKSTPAPQATKKTLDNKKSKSKDKKSTPQPKKNTVTAPKKIATQTKKNTPNVVKKTIPAAPKKTITNTANVKKATPKPKDIPNNPQTKAISPMAPIVVINNFEIKSIERKPAPVEEKINPSAVIISNNFEETPEFISSIKGLISALNKDIDVVNSSKRSPNNPLENAFILFKNAQNWKSGSVFVSKEYQDMIKNTILVAKSATGQFFIVQEDNTLTFIEDSVGISQVRLLQRVNFQSQILNGKDVEYLIAAKLATNPDSFNKMGEILPKSELQKLDYSKEALQNNKISGLFVVEDFSSGNLITFISSNRFNLLKPKDNGLFKILLYDGEKLIYENSAIYKNSRTYIPADEIIILDYKTSMGSYIAIKNIKDTNKLPKDIKNYKIVLYPMPNKNGEFPIEKNKTTTFVINPKIDGDNKPNINKGSARDSSKKEPQIDISKIEPKIYKDSKPKINVRPSEQNQPKNLGSEIMIDDQEFMIDDEDINKAIEAENNIPGPSSKDNNQTKNPYVGDYIKR